MCKPYGGECRELDDRQITHLICVRLRHLLHDFIFLGGVFVGKDQKGLHKRDIHDQGDFWTFPLETTV